MDTYKQISFIIFLKPRKTKYFILEDTDKAMK